MAIEKEKLSEIHVLLTNFRYFFTFSYENFILMNDFILEIQTNQSLNDLSKEQVNIFIDRAKGATYRALMKKYNLSGNIPLERSLVRTVQLKFWNDFSKGGSDPYLNGSDLHRYEKLLVDNANSYNALPIFMALHIAHSIKKDRSRHSIGQKSQISASRSIN